jgi:hypothetical protein
VLFAYETLHSCGSQRGGTCERGEQRSTDVELDQRVFMS